MFWDFDALLRSLNRTWWEKVGWLSPSWSRVAQNTKAFCWSGSWSGSRPPYSGLFHPLGLLAALVLQSKLSRFYFSFQGLFPKTRLNMNIHKQNGTHRLWKLSKTYLHLIPKEILSSSPYRKLATPSWPPNKILVNYNEGGDNPAILKPPKSSPLAPQTISSIPLPLGQTRRDQFCWGLFSLVMNNGWPSPLWFSTTVAPLNWPWQRAIHWPV